MAGWTIFDLADRGARTYAPLGAHHDMAHAVVASPGAGIYVAFLGSVLVMLGGLTIMAPQLVERPAVS